jgi:hypothetical protein
MDSHVFASLANKAVICHNCGEKGHKSTFCQNARVDRQALQQILMSSGGAMFNVMCHKCNMQGHYANCCPQSQSTQTKQSFWQSITSPISNPAVQTNQESTKETIHTANDWTLGSGSSGTIEGATESENNTKCLSSTLNL